jgi:hypothetical protein
LISATLGKSLLIKNQDTLTIRGIAEGFGNEVTITIARFGDQTGIYQRITIPINEDFSFEYQKEINDLEPGQYGVVIESTPENYTKAVFLVLEK